MDFVKTFLRSEDISIQSFVGQLNFLCFLFPHFILVELTALTVYTAKVFSFVSFTWAVPLCLAHYIFHVFHYIQLVPFLLLSWQSHADFPVISLTVCPICPACLLHSAHSFAAGHCHCTFSSGSQITLEIFCSFSLFDAWLEFVSPFEKFQLFFWLVNHISAFL